jgi:hypothetical protein
MRIFPRGIKLSNHSMVGCHAGTCMEKDFIFAPAVSVLVVSYREGNKKGRRVPDIKANHFYAGI